MDREDAATSEAFFVILEPGEAPPLHVHPDAEQVFFVLEGTADMTVGRQPAGDAIRLKPGRLRPDAARA